MERQENIKPSAGFAIVIIILFHLVGLVGLEIPQSRSLFLQLVPWHLLLMMTVLVFMHQSVNTRFILFILLLFIAAFAAEWTGIHTGLLFGSYAYGDTLGLKVYDVPLIIGVNWFLLIYSTGVLMQRSQVKSVWIRVTAGALLLILLDILIEPVAVRFNYWHWTGNQIPLKNYVCWFLLSGSLLLVFEKFTFRKQGVAGLVLLVVQYVFFLLLRVL
jgi:putative membrane protein